MRLENKVAIVTGASRGLGKGIAKKLAEEGAKVVIADILPADQAVAEIQAAGGTACSFTVNMTKQEEVVALVKFAVDTYGTLDIMVNNAGINRDGMLHKMSKENWDLVIDINLNGTFYGTQEAIKYMRGKNYGRIINISSGSWLGNIGQANYAASKAGVVGLTKTAARENAKKGITAIDLGAMVVKEAVRRANIPGEAVDEVIVGQVGEVAENGFIARAISLNDAAAAVVVMSREKAEELGVTPVLSIGGYAVAGLSADIMGYAPKLSSEKLAKQLGLSLSDIDMFEINEAFASQSFAVRRDLGLDPEKVNIYGGGISIGHPIGATGCILATKVFYELKRTDKKDAMISMCIGGGQGISMYFTKV